MTKTLTQHLAEFACGLNVRTIPSAVLEKARACMLNSLGVAAACHATPYYPVARAAVLRSEGTATMGATLLYDGRKVCAGSAAFVNAVLLHGRAQEDTVGGAHLGVVVLPPLLALIEARGLALDDLLPALVAGYEVGGAMERAYAAKTTPLGMRGTAIYGPMAAAAAASRLLGLDATRTAAALASASAFCGGTFQSFSDGSDEWRYQAGVAARLGLLSAELAEAGAIASPQALEGPYGFVRGFAHQATDVAAVASLLGKEWATLTVRFKPHPVCAYNQTIVEAALALRPRLGGRTISRVTVRMNPFELGLPGMLDAGPFHTVTQTLMSVRFCVATALVHGAPSLAALNRFQDPAVTALVEKIEVVPDTSVATLSCVLDVQDSAHLTETESLTLGAEDFSYDRPHVSELVRRLARETGVPEAICGQVEGWVDALPAGRIDGLLSAYAKPPAA